MASGVLARDLLDLDAAHAAREEDRAPRRAVDQECHVELPLDLGALLDEHAPDRQALDVHREDARRLAPDVLDGLADGDAARLAAAPDEHLSLHRDGEPDRLRGRDRLFRT